MEIERDNVVRFHYELSDDSGEPLESSRDREPLVVLFGHGSLIPGVEAALTGRQAGERFTVEVPPEQGYGLRRDGWVQRVSKKHVPGARRLRPGMATTIPTESGRRPVTVVKVGATVVDVDLNHPLAGRTLHFDIEVIEVREADPEEVAHRHVHGPGGHPH